MVAGLTRIHGPGWRAAITEAHRCIPSRILARLSHVQYVMGVDPVFAGLHSYVANGAYSLSETAHCAWPFHIAGPRDRRVTTIVMPLHYSGKWGDPHTLVHELGHALHETIRFDHEAKPVTRYAESNNWEAFAEAFTAWCWPGNGYARPDDATIALFESLA